MAKKRNLIECTLFFMLIHDYYKWLFMYFCCRLKRNFFYHLVTLHRSLPVHDRVAYLHNRFVYKHIITHNIPILIDNSTPTDRFQIHTFIASIAAFWRSDSPLYRFKWASIARTEKPTPALCHCIDDDQFSQSRLWIWSLSTTRSRQ